MVATAIGGVATQISSDWTVDIRTVCAVGGIVLPGVWWMSSRLTKFSDRLKDGDERFDRFEKLFEKIQNRLDTLPCHNWQESECPSGKKKVKDL